MSTSNLEDRTQTVPSLEAMPTLDDRIQSLAQELQDMILNFTIAPPAESTIIVTRDYQPPLSLQISRKTRVAFADKYYSSNKFEMSFGSHIYETPFYSSTAFHFLNSLTCRHLMAVRHLGNTDIMLYERELGGRFEALESYFCVTVRNISCSPITARLDPETFWIPVVDQEGKVKIVSVKKAEEDGKVRYRVVKEGV